MLTYVIIMHDKDPKFRQSQKGGECHENYKIHRTNTYKTLQGLHMMHSNVTLNSCVL